MSLNWKEIDLILSELDLPGTHIQKILQPTYDLLALVLYKEGRTRTLLIALTPGACRIHETFRAVPKSERPLRFAEFLKSRVRGGRIEEALQLGQDRIVRLSVRRAEETVRLYIRLWSNAANVIAVDEDGTVLDAMRRSPRRGEVTGGHYAPEFPAEKAEGKPLRSPKTERVFAVRQLEGEGSFNSRIDAWYAEQAGALSLVALREQTAKAFDGRINRLSAALENLRRKRDEYADADTLRSYGDLILANTASLRSGEEWLEVDNFYTGERVRIRVDPRKSAPANAEGYYSSYRKAKDGLGEVDAEIETGKAELERLQEEQARLEALENPLLLYRALRKLRAPKMSPEKKARPGLSFRVKGWLLVVGRGAEENDALLRKHVKGSDLWLHARDFPGAYVFVKARSGKTVPLDILLDAGNLALFYSKGRASGEGDLYYTAVKFLRRAKNGPKGLVLPTQEKNLRVKLDQSRIKRLEQCKEE